MLLLRVFVSFVWLCSCAMLCIAVVAFLCVLLYIIMCSCVACVFAVPFVVCHVVCAVI